MGIATRIARLGLLTATVLMSLVTVFAQAPPGVGVYAAVGVVVTEDVAARVIAERTGQEPHRSAERGPG